MEKKIELKDESEEKVDSFCDQFDPNSIHYHNGVETLVKIDQATIPDSMPTIYSIEYIKKSQNYLNYGEKYDKLQCFREIFMDLKKHLGQICFFLDRMIRHRDNFSFKGNPNNKIHVEKFQKNIDIERKGISLEIMKIENIILILEKNKIYKEKYVQNLEKVIFTGKREFKTREELASFNSFVSKVTNDVFTEMGNIMNEMKKIKKMESENIMEIEKDKNNKKNNNNNCKIDEECKIDEKKL